MKTFAPHVVLCLLVGVVHGGEVDVSVDLSSNEGLFDAGNHTVGQGGLSPKLMWQGQVDAVTALRPGVMRLFVQTFYLFDDGTFDWQSLDASVDQIRATGATPLLNLCFKPQNMFPIINQSNCAPNDWDAWDQLIGVLGSRYNGSGFFYEVLNEPDNLLGGGTPYLCGVEEYTTMYEHTAKALLAADSTARVGGPAVAFVDSDLLPALLSFCATNNLRLDFVSWHFYTDCCPWEYGNQSRMVRELVDAAYTPPARQPLLVVDEWGPGCGGAATLGFQPCFLLEGAFQLHSTGVAISNFYQLRDFHVDPALFKRFLPTAFAIDTEISWNYSPICYGLFDFQGHVRPTFFALKLLSRMSGTQHSVSVTPSRGESAEGGVHAMATTHAHLAMHSLLVWNFDAQPATVAVSLVSLAGRSLARCVKLDSAPAGVLEENSFLVPQPAQDVSPPDATLRFALEAYGIVYCNVRPRTA